MSSWSYRPDLDKETIKYSSFWGTRGNTLGEPYTKSLKGGLFEIRIKSDEGIARSIYCYEIGKRIIILLTFVKKTQKTPKSILNLAEQRLKEFKDGNR